MLNRFLLVSLFCSSTLASPTEKTEATYVDQQNAKKILFYFKAEPHKLDNRVRSERRYLCPESRKDQCPDGIIAAREDIYYRDDKAYMMTVEHYQAKYTASVVIENNRAKFSYIEGDHKSETDEKVSEVVLFPEEIFPFIVKNWDKLLKEDTLHFRFPVLFRKETVGFKVFKDRMDGDLVVFSMKPSSIFIQALVKPIYFYIHQTSKKIVKVDGRITPKLVENKSLKDLDAVMLF